MPVTERNMKNIFGVVDIGTQQVRVLIGQPDEGDRVSVLGLGIAPAEGMDESGVANIEKLVSAIDKALKQAIQHSQIAISRVWVVTNHIHMRGIQTEAIITFPDADHEISMEDLQRLRQQAVQRPPLPNMELIHVVPQYYSLDHREFVRDPLGMTGIRLEGRFYLVYAPQAHLSMLQKCFQRLQVQIEGFVARPIAAAEVFISREQKATGSALLYLGTHTTAIVLYENGILRHFTILPLGGHHVTMDIRELLKYVLPQQAEEIKVSQGVAFAGSVPEGEILRLRISNQSEPIEISRHTLAQVIQARLLDTMVFVGREIDQVGLLDRLYGGIHIAGGGVLMRDMNRLVEYALGARTYPVQIAPLLGRGMAERVNTPRMAGAIATLYLAPILREFMPPLTSPAPAKDMPRPAKRTQLLQKMRNFLENTLKLPQDLVD